jgi:serine/threonine-protein kinase
MALQPGDKFGPYELLAPAGTGGMGEVWKARDTRLDRIVAMKFSQEKFSERFEREAKAISSLNHANICTLHDVGPNYLVMEYIEGTPLKGPLPLDQALKYAVQICAALDHAHKKSITHRDLKPANILVTKAGIKLLDFGLAKIAQSAIPTSEATRTMALTGKNEIVGTLYYMSPEQLQAQATGQEIDSRSDIFSFGLVLYEMITGKRAFGGSSPASVIAAIMERPAPSIADVAPPALDRVLKTCLAKDPDDRWQTARDLKRELEWITSAPDSASAVLGDGGRGDRRHSAPWKWIALGVTIAALGVLIGGTAMRLAAPAVTPSPVARIAVAMKEGTGAGRTGGDRDIAISRDGTRIAYVGANGALFLRSLAQLDALPIAGLGGARGPFFSPDGQWIGFTDGRLLRKVAVSGGTPITICPVGSNGRGATWLDDDTIVFATNDPATGLWRVPAGGGKPVALTTPDHRTESGHLWPDAVPGTHTVLFTISSAPRPLENPRTALLDLDTGKEVVLLQGGSDAHYLSTGHILYVAPGAPGIAATVRAVGFDLARRTMKGQVVDVASVVSSGPLAGNFDVSRSGTLVYEPALSGGRTLTWVDRQGHEEPISAPARAYLYPRLSPDARRLALDIRDEESDIWIWEFARQTLTRLTTDPSPDRFPVWTADGHDILFTSERDGPPNIYRQSADGTSPAERLTNGPNTQAPMSVTPDGRSLVVRESAPLAALMLLPLFGTRQMKPLVKTPFIAQNGEVSPNGRWLAYEANDSGTFQIYVRPFPDVEAGRWQVSNGGGTQPLWSRDGQELFFLAPMGAVMAIRLERGADWSAAPPARLLYRRPNTGEGPGAIGGAARTYDVAPDGRFLSIGSSLQPMAGAGIGLVVVTNWFEELKTRVPVK